MSPAQKCSELARLFDTHGGALALYASQWCESPEDCVQEALIRLAGLATWPESPTAWLFHVTRNAAISAARAQGRRARHEAFAARLRFEQHRNPTPWDAESLATAVAELPETPREVLVAKIWGQLTLEEIAQLQGCSKSSVHRHYETALTLLREKIGAICPTNRSP